MSERAVIVTWVDSCSASGGPWMDRESAEEMKPLECVTIGFVVQETTDYITLASSATKDGQVAGDMCIPQACITAVEEVWSDE